MEKVLDRYLERFCDAGDVAAKLTGAIGFPLSHGAAAYVTGRGELPWVRPRARRLARMRVPTESEALGIEDL